jgi:hypothetical protein
MKNRTVFRLLKDISLPAMFLTFIPAVASAYVDPGSGSVIVTTILGLIAAVGYTFRKYFYKIRRVILGTKPETVEKKAASDNSNE